MKIAMFTDAYWPRVNGVTVSVDTFSRALIKNGHEVMIVCADYPDSGGGFLSGGNREDGAAPYMPKIVRVPSIPVIISKEDRLAKFSKWFWVAKQVELFHPDIIHINTEFIIAEFGFFYGKIYNLPVLYTFHTMWEDYIANYMPPMIPVLLCRLFARFLLKNILRSPYKIIVPTPQIEEVVKKYKIKKETFLLPTGIDPAIFEHSGAETAGFREKFEGRYPVLRGKRILLFAGRIAREKNLGFLLEVLPAIRSRYPETVLLFAGNGPDLEYFMQEAEDKGLGECCVFTGYMERSDLALVYAMSDIFVFPSLTETQGLVTLEAMFSGIPVVAIGEMGTAMVMGGDNGGFMVKNDPGEFTARVLDLLGDPGLYRRKSEEARLHASAWSIDSLTRKLETIYRDTQSAFLREYGPPRVSVMEWFTEKRKLIISRKNWWKWSDTYWKKISK
ncbi:MAG: glycosyltransferase [Spirochaetaceae bacterium]|jgi:glycosyltransferase involved in cell wall biosynthesis|nr:glycosyltransferase [Spirochaetaceae bacterium]